MIYYRFKSYLHIVEKIDTLIWITIREIKRIGDLSNVNYIDRKKFWYESVQAKPVRPEMSKAALDRSNKRELCTSVHLSTA